MLLICLFINAEASIILTIVLSPKIIDFNGRLVNESDAIFMIVMSPGIISVSILGAFPKHAALIVVNESGKLKVVKDEHPAKTLAAIVTILDGEAKINASSFAQF